MSHKILIAFDFDHTVVNENSDMVVFDMIKNESDKTALWSQVQNGKWTVFMNDIFQYHSRTGTSAASILSKVEKLELVEGLLQLFHYIGKKKDTYDCIIMSDSNSLFIQSVLKANNLEHYVKKIFTNPSQIDVEGKIVVYPCHVHTHSSCPENMCKGDPLVEYLKDVQKTGDKYHTVCYVGDGSNDFCPSTRLQSCDYVFPRQGFSLIKKLRATDVCNSQVKASVLPWDSGLEIKQQLEIIESKLYN